MGSSLSGFLFLTEPDFGSVAGAFPGHGVRGYAHVLRPVWLLDLYLPPRRGAHAPFTGRAPETTPRAPSRLLSQLEALLGALPVGERPPGVREVRLALAVAERAGVPTIAFAGDDEDLDVACAVSGGELERLRLRAPHLEVRHEGGRTEVTPLVLVEDDETGPDPALLGAVRRAVPWTIAPAREEGARPLHESALALWPATAGDPAAVLGLGTWDPGEPLAREFRVVFDRAAG